MYEVLGFELLTSCGGNVACSGYHAIPASHSKQSAKIPVGIRGLEDLLFPYAREGLAGFDVPGPSNVHGNVVPKIVVIEGGPGAGKTTMAIQMMVAMLQHGFNCSYWSSNDSVDAILTIAGTYEFVSRETLMDWQSKGSAKFSYIGPEYAKRLNVLGRKDRKDLEHCNVLFFDSLNVSQLNEQANARERLWEIFDQYRRLNILSIFLLEDYGSEAGERARQLISDCEFLSDVVIELGASSQVGFQTKALTVKKRHFGPQIYGSHCYKICHKEHGLSHVDHNSGIIVYPNIHRHLARARQSAGPIDRKVRTGITHLDSILMGPDKTFKPADGCLQEDSTVVIRGERGAHKFPLGVNLLMGGLWGVQRGDSADQWRISTNKDVLLILLDEEVNIEIDRVAVARNTHLFTKLGSKGPCLDNGAWIQWRPANIKHRRKDCPARGLFEDSPDAGKKVFLRKWCVDIKNPHAADLDCCQKLCVAGFRPGCITPEEFIYVVSELLSKGAFSRVLFCSTAHLRMRFPLLAAEKLLLPALVDLFKSRGIMSIFIDVGGQGSDRELSYGLSAMADYLIHLDSFAASTTINLQQVRPGNAERPQTPGLDDQTVRRLLDDRYGYVWAKMHVENVRGKDYSRPCHAVTVRPGTAAGTGNELVIVNAVDPDYTKATF